MPGIASIPHRSISSRRLLGRGVRCLATGVAYIRDLPGWATQTTLLEAAQESRGKVYGVWISHDSAAGRSRQAAIRITTEDVPPDLRAIAGLPDPSAAEVGQLKTAIGKVVGSLRERGVDSVPIFKDLALFQSVAKRATTSTSGSRDFDALTTSAPRYTRGMVDGYRQGFEEARRKRDASRVLDECANEEDELAFLASYFEQQYNHR
ncbi:hypothetical protein GQ54DRAFT_258361 [Martensiomyces pterosporus]|nr:hypothetical protein GQ54DRAFT_258361 [Martensiomyces pterosporus]